MARTPLPRIVWRKCTVCEWTMLTQRTTKRACVMPGCPGRMAVPARCPIPELERLTASEIPG